MLVLKLKIPLNKTNGVFMKKILVLALLFTTTFAQANNPCSFNIPKRYMPILAVAAGCHYLVHAPARKIKNTFKTIFKPSSVTRYEDNDSCC